MRLSPVRFAIKSRASLRQIATPLLRPRFNFSLRPTTTRTPPNTYTRTLATMSTIPGDNQACCTIPPVQSNYKPKGTFETYENISTYVNGDKTSKKAIVVVMDVFGMVPLTQQGCDILASQGFYVVMPDLLGDQALQLGDVPFDTPEKVEKRNKLFAGAGNPQGRQAELLKIGQQLKDEGFTVGMMGFCWGAKLVLLAGSNNVYSAVAVAHPSLLTPEDAANLKAPLALYPTPNEDAATMEPFVKIAKDYKLYSDSYHGFAAARAKLDNPTHKADYEDVYKRFSAFFKKYLS